MLRFSRALWLIAPVALLGGCPMYPDACSTDSDCDGNYTCDFPSGQCILIEETGPVRCNTSADCADGYTCDRYLRCSLPTATGGSGGTSTAGSSTGGSSLGGKSGVSGAATGLAGEAGMAEGGAAGAQ